MSESLLATESNQSLNGVKIAILISLHTIPIKGPVQLFSLNRLVPFGPHCSTNVSRSGLLKPMAL